MFLRLLSLVIETCEKEKAKFSYQHINLWLLIISSSYLPSVKLFIPRPSNDSNCRVFYERFKISFTIVL